MMKKILGGFFVFFLFFSFNFSWASDTGFIITKSPEFENSIVLVKVTKRDGYSLGTGFFVRKNLVVTALHILGDNPKVIALNNRYKFFSIRLYFINSDTEEAVIRYIDPSNDLAILQVEKNLRTPFKINTKVKPNEKVWVFGYKTIFKPYTRTTTVLRKIANLRDFFKKTANLPKEVFILKDVVFPGNSGGPIFNLKGEVVGFISLIYAESFDGWTGAVSSKVIEKALKIIKK